TRRYFNTPNWLELLKHFISKIAKDEYSYSMYENQARNSGDGILNLPKLASIISEDFNAKWYQDENFRTNDVELCEQVTQGVKPLKAEMAYYIKSFTQKAKQYTAEIDLLENLCKESISGIITTNYDTFLDELSNFKCYVGQSELLVSSLQGIAEIYKIHGSVNEPNSLVLDDKDYQNFDAKMKYISAKLLTIFLEYPVVFLGYSISDLNIKNIFDSILDCLGEDKRVLLKNSLFFIEYPEKDNTDFDITSHSISLGSRSLEMTKIIMSDYSLLYKSMQNYQMKIPVRILRHLRQAFFEYTINTEPSNTVQVLDLDDVDYEKDQILVTIGKSSDMSKYGLLGITSNDVYKDIFIDNLSSKFKADDILQAIVKLEKSAGILPKYKYIKDATSEIPPKLKIFEQYDDFLSETTKKNRYMSKITERSVIGILSNDKTKSTPAYYLQYLTEEEMNVEDLGEYLNSLFINTPNLFETIKNDSKRSDIRRLIRVFDFLKYKRAMNKASS
ncbi:MAG: SIR2 family protein, partial [Candidatus Kapaibacterium sp.]